ncbi:mask [Symbiodinium sp. CCMP2592]|nr:mask [Symbiodinium sp. CCMP2592]
MYLSVDLLDSEPRASASSMVCCRFQLSKSASPLRTPSTAEAVRALRTRAASSSMAPKKRPAASTKASVTISGGTFLKKHGIQDALQTILSELEDSKPSDPWTSLKAALEEKSSKKAKMDEEADTSSPCCSL